MQSWAINSNFIQVNKPFLIVRLGTQCPCTERFLLLGNLEIVLYYVSNKFFQTIFRPLSKGTFLTAWSISFANAADGRIRYRMNCKQISSLHIVICYLKQWFRQSKRRIVVLIFIVYDEIGLNVYWIQQNSNLGKSTSPVRFTISTQKNQSH